LRQEGEVIEMFLLGSDSPGARMAAAVGGRLVTVVSEPGIRL